MRWGSWVNTAAATPGVHERSATWLRVPATVTQADIQSHRGSKGGTSYTVTCRYTYTRPMSQTFGLSAGAETWLGEAKSDIVTVFIP